MSVQNVVLGQLVRRRGYGYELRDRLRELFSDVLGLSDTAVYPALEALERKGLIVEVEREPARREERWSNPRVVYEATPEGRSHFRRWMAEPARKAPLREELHMKLMIAEPEDVPALIEALRKVEDECRAQLRKIIEHPLDADRNPRAQTPAFGPTLVQDGVISHLQTTMEWAQRSRSALLQHSERSTAGAAAGARRNRP
ncbi:PadR family transcriptional regulator [Conexibacter woesei]|uniref:Transcriptional regulator, PadR-like family n=1 Tax=Conexibacter woesei (strain DSM 14684 / CCUG 47730 / CIP 108061 / JCM 11494 / NBRC 100937 / ID131577) TaxID=469383 RepID=D3F1A0_CONWI|nr:PadR family transcriptional regulator [Conexibacter woesei]ADB52063.1 transcriptional regulator, PadR-like family [Conexibacter woesei DSM 14684]